MINGWDHMRMIAKVVENKLNEGYARLVGVHNLVGEKVKYAADPKAGFLVSSPDEIGTGGFGVVAETKEGGKRVPGRAKFGASVNDVVNSVFNELTVKP